jgi:C4-dicarboxylate-specific signal transduction histidine kinase
VTLARRKLGPARVDRSGAEALDLQRFANAGRLAAALWDDLLGALGMVDTDVGLLSELLPGEERADQRDAAVEARSSLSRAAADVAAVLSVARPRAEQVAALRVAEVVQAALFDLEGRLAGLSVRRALDEEARALADRGALLQSVISLLLDAADAAHPRGRITVTVKGEEGRVALIVEDDGPAPLAPDTLAARVDSPLFVCRNVLRSFGADLSVAIGPLGGRQVTVALQTA